TGRTNGCLTTTRCTGPFWPRCERSARPSLAPDKRARSAASASNSASERLVREPDREAGRPGSPSVLRSLPRGHWPNLMKTSKRSVYRQRLDRQRGGGASYGARVLATSPTDGAVGVSFQPASRR